MAVASTGYILIGKESTFGVAPTRAAANYKFYPAEEAEITPGKEFIDFQEIRGSRQAMVTLDGPFRPTANMSGAFYPCSAAGLFIGGIFGADTVTTDGDGNSVHTFSDAATLPSFTIERADAHRGAKLVEYVTGCKIESLQLACAFGEKVDLSVQFQAGRTPDLYETGNPAAPQTFLEGANISGQFPTSMLPFVTVSGVEKTVDPMIFKDATIYLTTHGTAWDAEGDDKIAYMKSINLEFRNTITRQETLRGQNGQDTYKLFEGGFETTLSGTAVFDDLVLYNAMINGTRYKIKLVFENNTLLLGSKGHKLTIEFPDVKVSRASIPFRAGEVIESDVEFKVRFDQANSKSVSVTLVNGESSPYV